MDQHNYTRSTGNPVCRPRLHAHKAITCPGVQTACHAWHPSHTFHVLGRSRFHVSLLYISCHLVAWPSQWVQRSKLNVDNFQANHQYLLLNSRSDNKPPQLYIGDSDVISSQGIYASCFPAMAKSGKCLLLWHYLLGKLVIIWTASWTNWFNLIRIARQTFTT